jgi:PAS domain S-box-containing protein
MRAFPAAGGRAVVDVFARSSMGEHEGQNEKESARLLSQLVETQAHVGSWNRDLITEAVTFSNELLELIFGGKPPAVPTFESFLAQVHPDDRERVRLFTEEEIAGTIVNRDIEYRVQHGDGTVRVLHSSSEVTRDASGRALREFGTAIEITDRWRAAAMLNKIQRLLLRSEVLGGVGSWEYNLVTGEVLVTEGNRRLFFGDDRGKGSRVEDFAAVTHPEDRERVARRQQQLLDGEKPQGLEYRIVWADGSVRVIHGVVEEVIHDGAGRPLRAFGTNADVTERRRGERERDLRISQQAALAQLGQSALRGGTLRALFDEALSLLVRTSGADFAEVTELLPDDSLLLSAGAGWREGMVGRARLRAGSGSQYAFALVSGEPSVVEDSRRETRFSVDPLILEQGIVSGVTVLIKGHDHPFGTLGTHSKALRVFTQDEVNFAQSLASVLAAAIDRDLSARQLREKREQLQVLSRKLLEAQEAERRAIALELHDDFGQVLAAIRLDLQHGGRSTSGSLALIDEAISRLRDLALNLRPAILDDLGLAAALRWYVGREMARAGLEAALDLGLVEGRLPPTLETTCFRVVQEALNNVVRHAGARRVEVALRTADGGLELSVSDDGKGFDPQAARKRAAGGASLGLLTMEERVWLAGGKLSIESTSLAGTRLRARFPLQPPVDS